jgi:hypothetical protein
MCLVRSSFSVRCISFVLVVLNIGKEELDCYEYGVKALI